MDKNSLEKSQRYLDIVLDLFKRGSITGRLDSESQQFDWKDHGNAIRILKLSTTGFGDYKKDVGYPQGAITAVWETIKLECDRGVKFLFDRVDDMEMLGLTIGRAAQNFVDYQMVPELDAFRFAKYADGGIKGATETLDNTNILAAFDRAKSYMNNHNVPREGRILYVNEDLETAANNALKRVWGSDSVINTEVLKYNDMEIIYVPPNRFHDEITLNSGDSDQWGYVPGGNEINFMLLYPKAVVQAWKANKVKFIDADDNQTVDSHEFQFRFLHDASVIDHYKDGVYSSIKE